MDKAKKNTVIHAAADRMAANYKSSQIPMYGDALRMPNRNAVIEIIRDCQKLIFPVYYGDRDLLKLPPEQYSALLMEHIHEKLTRQITLTMPECDENCEVAYAISTAFIERIPAIQELLLKDLSANFEGDPAAYSKEEVLLSYPGMFAIFIYRIAHELYENKVAMIPRMMSEYAHSQTGIDINPGAKIGEYFFIDHGTGVVVGETTIIRDCQKLIFPVYYGDRDLLKLPPEQYSALLMEHIHEKLTRQITLTMPECDENCEVAYAISTAFIERIPAIQELLLKDLSANFEGDPAAYSKEEVLLSYPGMFAIFIYRIAHELYENKVAMIPRMMSEYAHSQTGIDINPGAKIGEYFFIDHGTGVVVGETTIIGDNVKLYQGATLGALSPAGMATNPNVRRHPKVGNNVVIYANSTLLGGATEIGDNVVVGGNAFLTSSVAPNTVVSVKNPEMTFRGKHHRG